MKNKVYLFDFDGTLVDSMPAYVGVMTRILYENNISYDESIIKIITPLGFEGTAAYFQEIGIKKTKEELGAQMKKYAYDEYAYNIPAKKNVVEVLGELKKRGASLNVLTASPHVTLDPCLKRIGIYDIFDNVWSCDDFHTTKADPEIYKKAADALGVDVGDILFLDDNINADKTAKEAGAMVCGVFDESSADIVEQMKEATDMYIYNFSELL